MNVSNQICAMNFQELNKRVKQARDTNQFSSCAEDVPGSNRLPGRLLTFGKDFEEFLFSRLLNLYKNYFPFDEPDQLDRYFTPEGVSVERDKNGNPRLRVIIESHPLRIVLKDLSNRSQKIAWQLNA